MPWRVLQPLSGRTTTGELMTQLGEGPADRVGHQWHAVAILKSGAVSYRTDEEAICVFSDLPLPSPRQSARQPSQFS
jgi:hypothetical protein